jgi:C-terminal processing protease CtpA/Prc
MAKCGSPDENPAGGQLKMREAIASVSAAIFFVVMSPSPLLHGLPKVQTCAAIENLGTCDAYVPGVIIGKPGPDQPMRVFGTWPQGPAEKAGICSGDQILAVNGVSTSDNPMTRSLEEIVSDSPTPIRLELKRDSEIKELDVGRVRESTLAELSKQKFALVGGVLSTVIYVPADELPSEIQQFRKFQDRIAARYGFKSADAWYVPRATQRSGLERVLAARQDNTMLGRLGFAASLESYSAGFLGVLLPKSNEVLVDTVVPDSPAYRVGLLPGDQIVEIDGHDTSGLTIDKIGDLLLEPDEQRVIKMKLNRDGSAMMLSVGTRQMKDLMNSDFDPVPSQWSRRSADDYILGIHALFSAKPNRAAVAAVDYPSPAFNVGLHVGDLLLSINGSPIAQIDRQQLNKLLTPAGSAKLFLEFSQLGKRMNLTITPVTYRQALASIGRKPTKFGTAPDTCSEH